MAKVIGRLFERKVRTSGNGGVIRAYFITEEQRRLLGAGDVIVFHGYVYQLDTAARATFKLTHGVIPGDPPRETGTNLTPTGNFAPTNLGPFTFILNGDFAGEVDVVAEVDQNIVPTTTQVMMEFELWSTVIRKGA